MISRPIRAGIAAFSVSLSFSVTAADYFYCPQNHGYINVGMTSEQVMSACGQPLTKEDASTPVMQQVPVLQLIYNSMGAPTAFYGVWTLPVGVGTGAQLEVDVIDNKVRSVRLNGSSTNAFSICGGQSVQIGDPVGKVYGACGSPNLVNRTYINQPVPSNHKPEIWVYQPGEYQSPIRLTFVNGKLQSIN